MLKDPSHAIFLESREFKDIRYDAYNDKDNDQEKDNDNDNDKDKDKDESDAPTTPGPGPIILLGSLTQQKSQKNGDSHMIVAL